MVTKSYPPAKANPKPPGGGTFSRWEKLVLHTTETSGLPSYPSFAPHLTYNPWTHTWWQHIPLDRSATTLADSSSTAVRENRDNAVQVEIVAYCDPPKNVAGRGVDHLDDRAVRDLAAFAAWLNKNGGLPLRLASGWLPYPRSYGNTKNRMSGPQYDAFTGICGHEHVSSNDHGDPGDPPWLDTFLTYAKQASGTTAPPATGKGSFMATSTDVWVNYSGNQTLKPGDNEIEISPTSKTVVIGPSTGVDMHAMVTVVDASGGRVPADLFFRIVSHKTGTPTLPVSSRDGACPPHSEALYKGDISALKDKTRSPRLRLVVNVPAGETGLVVKTVEISGWKL